uniref:Uncharacterized protein n=1 Tax=viral metagenome TaxID=1070528 RepID=A0A6C0IIF7_9ZZZZ
MNQQQGTGQQGTGQQETGQQEMSQKQLAQMRSILGWSLENERDYSDDDSDEEDPEPIWNIPNWKGNANKCTGCVTRIMSDGENRGCADCDECWNMPELVEIICTGCTTRVTNDGDNRGCVACDEYWDMPDLCIDNLVELKPYCEGCELLDAGLGGENQMSHTCMGF